MDEPWKHDAQWEKPDTKDHTVYHSIDGKHPEQASPLRKWVRGCHGGVGRDGVSIWGTECSRIRYWGHTTWRVLTGLLHGIYVCPESVSKFHLLLRAAFTGHANEPWGWAVLILCLTQGISSGDLRSWRKQMLTLTPNVLLIFFLLLPTALGSTWVAGDIRPNSPHPQHLGILVPQPGIECRPSAVKAQSLNHWETREVP